MIDEFIDSYSDDQIYLEMIEKLVNNHPEEGNIPDQIKYSSFSRLWIVMMVGSIEMMIKKWAAPEIAMADIADYFNEGSNEERLDRLYAAFQIRGLDPDRSCFDDYLACKYIRNAYIHGKWNERQREYVKSKGLPSSLMGFSKEDYERVKKCYNHIMNGLGFANMMNNMIKSRSGL